MKNIFYVLVLFFATLYQAKAQTYNMTNGSFTTCSGTFYDSGGSGGSYTSNQNRTLTFYPATPGAKVQLDFGSFSLESNYDYLSIYDGNSTSSTQVGRYTGRNNPGQITSSAPDGSLTIFFTSDGSIVSSGWAATVSCCASTGIASISATSTSILFGSNTTLNATNACGNTTSTIQWQQSIDSMSWADVSGATNTTLTTSPPYHTYYRAIRNSNGQIDTIEGLRILVETFHLVNSSSVAYTCSGIFRDPAGAASYSNNTNVTQTFYPLGTNAKLGVNFSTFGTEACCDRLIVYNGNSTNAPVLGTYAGNALPPTLISTATDGSLTFRFTSDGSNTGVGWEGNFFCTGNSTGLEAIAGTANSVNTVCQGVNFDLNISQNFGDVQWQTSTDALNWSNISGATSATSTVSQITDSSYYRAIVTLISDKDTSNIIQVISDCYQMGSGTSFTTCSGRFYDAGGISGNYPGYEANIQTFYPNNTTTDKLSVSFTSFTTYDNSDYLRIYNGNNSSAPLIGSYSGNNIPPDITSTATDGSLTFYWYSSNSSTSNAAGWVADFSCCNVANSGLVSSSDNTICAGENFDLNITNQCGNIQWEASSDNIAWSTINGATQHSSTTTQLVGTYYRAIVSLNGTTDTSNTIFVNTDCYLHGTVSNPSTCNTTYYDQNGFNGNYGNSQNSQQTFYPNSSTGKLVAIFNSFNTEANYDFLRVYDGNSSAAPLVGTFSGTSIPSNITSTATDGSLTFVFTSDGSATRAGWDITLLCDCDTSQTYFVTHTPLLDVCQNESPIVLGGGNPNGGTYTGTGIVNGTTFDPTIAGAGTFTLNYNYTNTLGCSGDTTIDITVLPVGVDTISAAICQGDNYFIGGNAYSNAGSYNITFTSTNGCDSIVTLNLSVNPLPTVQLTGLNNTYCTSDAAFAIVGGLPSGGTFSGNGIFNNTFDPSNAVLGNNSMSYTYTDTNNCTNTDNYNVVVISGGGSTLNHTICQDDSYLFGGNAYTTAGTYYDTLTATNGCDSIITLNLSVNPLPAIQLTSFTTTYCTSDSAFSIVNIATPGGGVYSGTGVVNGNMFDPGLSGSGLHTIYYAYIDGNGCTNNDSVVVEVLGINRTNLLVNICQGDTYNFGNVTYSTAGTYVDSLTSTRGCDSIVTLNLNVNAIPNVQLGLNTTYCLSQGAVVLSAGIPTGGVYAGTGIINGNVFDPTAVGGGNSTTLTYTYTDNNGCTAAATDSTLVLNSSTSTVNDSICQGDTYVFNGNGYTTAGTYTVTLVNTNGCDSTVTLNLNILPLPNTILTGLNSTYCITESAVTLSGTPIGGVYTGTGISGNTFDPSLAGVGNHTISYNYTNANNCSHTAVAVVTVLSSSSNTITASICQGDSYTLGNMVYTNAGTYRDTTTNANGCDSVITLNLSVINAINTSLSASICQGDNYTFGGNSYTNAGTYQDTLTNNTGCDSIVTLVLTVNNSTNATVTASICQGDSYTFGNMVYTNAGMYQDTVTNANGCDSVITLNLSVNALPVVQIIGLDSVYCDTLDAFVVNVSPTGGTLSGLGVVGNQFDPAMAFTGTNTISYSYTDNNNCSNTTAATTRVDACSITSIHTVAQTEILLYPNPTSGQITIEQSASEAMQIEVFGEDGKLLLQRTTNAVTTHLELTEQASGVYFVRMTTATKTAYKKVILIRD